jgi:CII-binding regulator of phage lambda lysogenization HflD
MNEKNNMTSVIVTAAIATAGIALIIFIVLGIERKMEDEKKLKNRVIRKLQSVPLKQFDKKDRPEIKKLVNQYVSRVKSATSKVDIYAAKDTFEDLMDRFRTRATKARRAGKDRIQGLRG